LGENGNRSLLNKFTINQMADKHASFYKLILDGIP
jgi:hypothetical protein